MTNHPDQNQLREKVLDLVLSLPQQATGQEENIVVDRILAACRQWGEECVEGDKPDNYPTLKEFMEAEKPHQIEQVWHDGYNTAKQEIRAKLKEV